jgi:hypothetical protein
MAAFVWTLGDEELVKWSVWFTLVQILQTHRHEFESLVMPDLENVRVFVLGLIILPELANIRTE